MVGQGSKSGRTKQAAIDALLEQPTVAEAARVIDITAQKLGRWMKEPEFEARLLAARSARIRQQKARLRQGASAAAMSKIELMHRGKPATQLKAARDVIRLAEDANEIEKFVAGVRQVKRAGQAGAVGREAFGKGHGAKLPRKKEEAIVQLLKQRSVDHAARAAGIGTQTLYTWLKHPAFDAAYLATARAVFGPAMMLLQNRYSDAVTIVRKLSTDRTIPAATRDQAAQYILEATMQSAVEEQEAGVVELEPANASLGDPPVTSKVIGRSLHQRLKLLQTRLLPASRHNGLRMIFVHADDGRPAGSSVIGPDGRHFWWDPPEGCKQGELVEAQQGPVGEQAA